VLQSFHCLPFALIGVVSIQPGVPGQQPPTTSRSYVASEVPDTPAGLQSQVDELVRIGKTHDQTNWQIVLGTFSLPDAESWLQANFAPEHLAQLMQDYSRTRDGHLGHISWVIGQHQDAPNFHIQVAPSEMPSPPSDSGPESSLPLPLHPVGVQNFRLTPIADSGSMPPSWVNSFVYADGHFRVVGGTYPFWSEQLQSLRASPSAGPIAYNVRAARILHKVSPKYPKKARKERVQGVVRLHAIIGKDGTVHELSVISGPALLTDAALQAVRQWRYEPTLLNGEPVEVDTTIDVIFALN
jgi:TonB family protein